MKALFLAISAVLSAGYAGAAELRITADRIAADRATESLVASGHVVAVAHPAKLTSEYCVKDSKEHAHFYPPTAITTCTNAPGSLHWSLTGEMDYHEGKGAWVRDAVFRFCEIPFFWLPYAYYPLEGESGWRCMPGYTGRWGAYFLSKYIYDVAGDSSAGADGRWMNASSRFDLRWRNGVALGQTFNWQLGGLGHGMFKVYYAWDEDYDHYDANWSNPREWNFRNWGSTVSRDRWGIQFEQDFDLSELDRAWVKGNLFSDSYFRRDFFRDGLLILKNRFAGYDGNEIAYEHLENWGGGGVSVSGPLNEFAGGTARLPEFYFDVAPTPVPGGLADYESENRLGFLHRGAAEYGDSATPRAYRFNPGEWARYSAARLDTYHRLTAPFRILDAVSAAPRIAYRGTFWSESGSENTTGAGGAGKTGNQPCRSIVEGGVTFAARGTAEVSDRWRHVIEPYLDILAQEAWYSGLSGGSRPYVFDSLDTSMDWSDQFAGRSRNLPYSYYGATPGLRNAFLEADEKTGYRRFADIDVYAAFQFNDAAWTEGGEWHRLAEPGRPDYGDANCIVVPGVRLRYFPTKDTSLSGRFEYDSENNRIALAGVRWNHRLDERFKYYASVMQRDYRWWDFSSTPYDRGIMESEDFNRVHFFYAEVGFEHELCDAVAYSPFLRWDGMAKELDAVGAWIDYRTDCLGFRLLLEYDNSYTRIDGSEYEEDWNIGFFVYLRVFGPDSCSSLLSR